MGLSAIQFFATPDEEALSIWTLQPNVNYATVVGSQHHNLNLELGIYK